MKYVLERFEGKYAVIEENADGKIRFFNVQRALLPTDAAEGDVLVLKCEKWILDQSAAAERRKALCHRLKNLNLI